MENLLDDFFATVDKVKATEEKKAKAKAERDARKLKRYIRPDESTIKKEKREPLYVAMYWTKATCACGACYERPTYPGAPAYVYYPNAIKRGVAEFIPIHTFDAFSHIPHKVIYTEEKLLTCPKCFNQKTKQRSLPFPIECLDAPEEFIKPTEGFTPIQESQEIDIRDVLDNPETLSLLEDIE